jgi:hypothetical protein
MKVSTTNIIRQKFEIDAGEIAALIYQKYNIPSDVFINFDCDTDQFLRRAVWTIETKISSENE